MYISLHNYNKYFLFICISILIWRKGIREEDSIFPQALHQKQRNLLIIHEIIGYQYKREE